MQPLHAVQATLEQRVEKGVVQAGGDLVLHAVSGQQRTVTGVAGLLGRPERACLGELPLAFLGQCLRDGGADLLGGCGPCGGHRRVLRSGLPRRGGGGQLLPKGGQLPVQAPGGAQCRATEEDGEGCGREQKEGYGAH